MLELLIVADVAVALTQVAIPWVLMLVLVGSDVDHTPMKSGTKGQFPSTEEAREN